MRKPARLSENFAYGNPIGNSSPHVRARLDRTKRSGKITRVKGRK